MGVPRRREGKQRRAKPVRLPLRATLRYDEKVASAVDDLRRAVAKHRGISVTRTDDEGRHVYRQALSFSRAIRMLVVENERAARLLAGAPQEWPTSQRVDLPQPFWDVLTGCDNRLSHAQGSLYGILRKVNFDQGPVTREEFGEAFAAVADAKEALQRLEAETLERLDDLSAGDGPAEDAPPAGRRYRFAG